MILWLTIVGSFIGKTPFSKISPKKHGKELLGGAVLSIADSCNYWDLVIKLYSMTDRIFIACYLCGFWHPGRSFRK
ncbi:MAG: hypothetical protein WKF59_18495 [Chitinophagaceae bacterium]